jgi:hypothetical protein
MYGQQNIKQYSYIHQPNYLIPDNTEQGVHSEAGSSSDGEENRLPFMGSKISLSCTKEKII